MSDDLSAAVEAASRLVGCGDNSCLFVKPTGMATNGGCQCLRKPFFVAAMANLYKAALALAAMAVAKDGEA